MTSHTLFWFSLFVFISLNGRMSGALTAKTVGTALAMVRTPRFFLDLPGVVVLGVELVVASGVQLAVFGFGVDIAVGINCAHWEVIPSRPGRQGVANRTPLL